MTDKELCANAALERPRYFPRQMLTQAELTLEQNYFRDRFRRHNRLLHGWGVVCGANICAIPNADNSGPETWQIRITPGYILGPYGDEIVIDCERVVDLRTAGVTGMAGESPVDQVDPWCSQVFVDRREGPFYIAVKYKEIMTRPVRVQPIGCGCDDTQCEYSRWRDGYEIGILSECPDSHKEMQADKGQHRGTGKRMSAYQNESDVYAYQSPPSPPIEDQKKDENEPTIYFEDGCPACPSDPWVILGLVQVGPDGAITGIDNCACRRMAPTLALLARACHRGPIGIRNVHSDRLAVGATDVSIEVEGTGFETGARASLGNGVTVKSIEVKADGTRLTFKADVSQHATAGARTLTITNPDCSTVTKAVTVAQVTAKSPPQLNPIPGMADQPATQPASQRTATGRSPSDRAASKKGRR
ncbi:MAG: hypothetical protein WCB68_17050 [Pyrinomonadaceae bacterium]